MFCGWLFNPWWTLSAGATSPSTVKGWSSSCSHPNLVPHDYSQFHSRRFLLRQTAAAKCQSTEESAQRWGRKLERGRRDRLVSQLHHQCLGVEVICECDLLPGARWRGMRGDAWSVGLTVQAWLYVDRPVPGKYTIYSCPLLQCATDRRGHRGVRDALTRCCFLSFHGFGNKTLKYQELYSYSRLLCSGGKRQFTFSES